MFNFKCIYKKLNKIALGVTIFLCSLFVIELKVNAIAAEITNFVEGKRIMSFNVKLTAGENACFGLNDNKQALKYICTKVNSTTTKTVYPKTGTVVLSGHTDKCSSNYSNRYSTLSGAFELDARNFEFGKYKCEVNSYLTTSNKWNEQSSDGSFWFAKKTITIKHSGITSDAVVNYNNSDWENDQYALLTGATSSGINSYYVTLPNITAPGYKLKGFTFSYDATNKCDKSGEIIKPGSSYLIDRYLESDKTFYACWEKETNYKFSFIIDGNGGTVNGKAKLTGTCSASSCNVKTSNSKNIEYVRNGYVLKGFDTNPSCGNYVTLENAKLTEKNSTIYACWKTSVESECNKLTTKSSCTANSKCSWADTMYCPTGVTCYHCGEKKVTTTTTTTTKSFKIHFDGNGGTVYSGSTEKSILDYTCSSSKCTQKTLPTAKRSGYIFKGWNTSKTCNVGYTKYESGTIFDSLTKETTYYACWEEETTTTTTTTKKPSGTNTTYLVGFSQSWGTGLICESGYGSSQPGYCSKRVYEGTTIKLPSSSSYNSYDNNYKFMGWTSSPLQTVNGKQTTVCTSDTIKAVGSSYKVNNNTEFYACYREDVNGTRYALDGASADGQSIPCGTVLNITECVIGQDNISYCKYNKLGINSVTGIVYRDKITIDKTAVTCSSYSNPVTPDGGTNSDIITVNDYKYGTVSAIIDQDFQCGAKLYITTCNQNVCNFVGIENPDGTGNPNVTGTVNRKYLKNEMSAALNDTANCPKVDDSDRCKNKVYKDVQGTLTFEVCYPKEYEDSNVRDMLINDKLFTCKDGYTYDVTAIRASGSANCGGKVCRKNFTVTCEVENKSNSVVVTTRSAMVDSDGYGDVSVTAYSTLGSIAGYYISEEFVAPTLKSEWVEQTSSKFTVRSTPGVKYIWVKDTKGVISGVATVLVIDNVNSNTTLRQLSLTDGNSNSIVPNTVSYVSNVNDGFKLLTNAVSNKPLVAKGFDPYTPEYKIEVESPTLTVYSTLTSTDSSYVDGYGPRTVNLKYGVNTILIKIRNKEGKIRTYTILATRVDDRSSDNTLNNISLSVGNIEFNSNVTDYKIDIPSNTSNVKVTSILNSDLASYVSGYEPGEVKINGDTTVKLIKVQSQTGSTRTYVLTFVKEKTDLITDETLQLAGLTIPGVYVPFESNVANYNISVDYTLDTIDIYTSLKDDNSLVSVSLKKKNDKNYSLVSSKGINLDVGENFIEIKVVNSIGDEAYYKLTIIRKEYGLGISKDTALKDLKVLGYDIKFDPKDKEYTVRIKTEKSLVITAVPNSNRAEVFIRGNEELTGFSTVRIKVVAENGEYETYSIDIKKDAFNKAIEIGSLLISSVVILVSSYIVFKKKKLKNRKDYYRE